MNENAVLPRLLNVGNVEQILGIGRNPARRVIRQLNEVFDKQGFYPIKGKVNTRFFMEKLSLTDADIIAGLAVPSETSEATGS